VLGLGVDGILGDGVLRVYVGGRTGISVAEGSDPDGIREDGGDKADNVGRECLVGIVIGVERLSQTSKLTCVR
jgi:hypothetical protein